MIIRQFYEKLGDFLFVLSKVDGSVHAKEEQALSNEILEILKEHPGFEKNAEVKELLLTKLHFFNGESKQVTDKFIIDDFLSFLDNHGGNISQVSKDIAARLINKLADAYKGIGKAEQKMISRVLGVLELQPTQKK